LLDRARLLGPQSGAWAEGMLKQRGVEGIRVLQGFLHLATPESSELFRQRFFESYSLFLGLGVWSLL